MIEAGRAIVDSPSQTSGQYVVNGTCERPDAKRPDIETWCQPKIVGCILKQVEPLARQTCYDVMEAAKAKHNASMSTLPEAPASVNCDVDVAGRNVQVVLGDQDERR